ncbi:hypothetical protein ACSW9K_15980 (plasmid) [Clostridium perfringens]|uniref:Uncharacterized protein n=2 Tax=Clostridium perfringens TaxID=1502 RepID=A0A8H9UYT5_CLOPF|nr:hypothetical protein [Clostridium perfringens]EDT15782.1 hypothetical protein AC3_A0145 [Clostridium perfringens E str. JGS1987]MCX0408674.1 hypothetical protein [Clostridium perfringens]UBK51325.1 hypothetical protein KLF52_15480 [Clostridium perfringens]HAT4309345.1 hypothetical protein [Clostridium perfringens]
MLIDGYRDLTDKIFETIKKFNIINQQDIPGILNLEEAKATYILQRKYLNTTEVLKEPTLENIFNIRMKKIDNINKEELIYLKDIADPNIIICTQTPKVFLNKKEEYLKLLNFISVLASLCELTSLNDIYVLDPENIVLKRILPNTGESETVKIISLNPRTKKEFLITEDEIKLYGIERVILLVDAERIQLYKEYLLPEKVNQSIFTNYNGKYITAKTILELKSKIK